MAGTSGLLKPPDDSSTQAGLLTVPPRQHIFKLSPYMNTGTTLNSFSGRTT